MEQRADFCSDIPEKASIDFNQQGLELVEKCLEIFKKKNRQREKEERREEQKKKIRRPGNVSHWMIHALPMVNRSGTVIYWHGIYTQYQFAILLLILFPTLPCFSLTYSLLS